MRGKRLTELWARLHVATGLRKGDFLELELGEVEALNEALYAAEREQAGQRADLYALLCNLLGGGKRTWSREDFLPKGEHEAAPPAEVEAGLRAYAEAVAKGREKRKRAGIHAD